MHIPDGFIDLPTSAAFAGVSALAVGACLKGAAKSLDEKTAPNRHIYLCSSNA